jgi:ACS family glucarate transporter-like MFS transporter
LENCISKPRSVVDHFQLFLHELCFLSLFQLVFFYLVDVRKVTQQQAGIFTSVQWIAGAIGATIGGYLCDYFARRYGPRLGYRLIPIPSLILSGISLLIGAIAQNSYLAVTFLSISFGCTQLTEGSFWAATASVSGRNASTASGLLNTGGNVAGGIGALLVPVTAKIFGWTVAVSTGCIFAFIAALLWLFIRSDIPMIHGEQK